MENTGTKIRSEPNAKLHIQEVNGFQEIMSFSTFKIFFFFAVFIVFLPLTVSATTSKRDCVVCHIMWMEDFRTDKETLIEWQPGNVLMKDTQGVVSSEEICYTCHDGYVNDSRYITWKYNRHKVFVKPSNKVTIPPEMPLSVKGEIYCGTCHSAHGKGAAPHGNPLGLTSLFREINIESSLCEKCHVREANYKVYNGHPLHTTALEIPETLYKLGSKRGSVKNIVMCQSCHRVHGARGDKILVTNNNNSELCMMCHTEQASLIDTKHDLRITLPNEKNIKQQPLSLSGPCGACHTPHNSSAKKLWARPLNPGNPAAQMCLSCHGEDSGYNTRSIGRFSHPINVKPGLKQIIPKDLPLFSAEGEKTFNGNVQCFSCHDIHRWDPESPSNKGGIDIEGDSSNSFLRISNSSASTLCLECHVNKKQLITSDHNLSVTAPDATNIKGDTVSVSGPCGACHLPHNAYAEHMWARERYGEKDFVTQLCTGCHNKNGIAKAKLTGDIYHPIDVTLEKFNITTDLPLYDGSGNKIIDGKIVCITCHEPHVWSPSKAIINYQFKNVEGNASNSFLRKPASPYSDLCESCHSDKALIDETDHDLNITAPNARNLLGQTVEESGQCGACHLVHNSVNKLKLWARPYGPVSAGESIMNALCTSCHSRNNPGENKIPLIAVHPEDKLINNIFRCKRSDIDFAPIYDEEGNEVNVGNISCPTCHNAHQWSPLSKKKGVSKNIEGTAINSFLRNISYNNICLDCHGLDALFRYKYFHDPVERVEIKSKSAPGQ